MCIDEDYIRWSKELKIKYPELLMPFTILEVASFYHGWSSDHYCAGWMGESQEHLECAIEWYYERKQEYKF